MASIKQLYDGSESFQPYTEAQYIPSGVTNSGYTVKEDLQALLSSIQTLQQAVSGGTEVAGALGVVIKYANIETPYLNDATRANVVWEEVMNIPTSLAPYAWKKTEYTWTVDNTTSVIKTTYEIIATALYPETQVMYLALETVIDNAIQGPADYGVTMIDQNGNQSIEWHNYFEGISPSKPFGYMAIRHRDAGQDFPTTGTDENKKAVWNISLFSLYPMNQQSE